jgi:hypothetical protein
MKKLNIIFCLLIIFLFVGILHPQTVKIYKNLKFNYKITIPDKWEVEEKPSKNNPAKVTITDPDGYKLTITSKIDKAYSGKTANDVEVGTMYTLAKKDFKDANFLESDYAVIDNNIALYCRYSYNDDGKEYVIIHYYIIKNSTIYTLQVMAKTENIEYFENLSRGYIYSFSIADVTAPNVYKNNNYGFRIIFPDGWKVKGENKRFGAETNDGSSIYIEINDDQDLTGYSANDLTPDDLVEILRTKYPDAQIYEKSYTSIDNFAALYIRYKCNVTVSGKLENYTLIHYYIIRRGALYILQGMSPSTNYESNRETMIRSLESFQFLEESYNDN